MSLGMKAAVVGALRLTARDRDHRNDHRADGAAGLLRDSRRGHHAAPLHVRSLDRVRVSSGLEACISRDLWRRPRSHVRPRDPRAYGGDGRREDNPRGRHGEPRCARISGHACECGWHGVSRCMWPCRCSLPALGCPEAPSFRSTMVGAEAGDAIDAHKVD